MADPPAPQPETAPSAATASGNLADHVPLADLPDDDDVVEVRSDDADDETAALLTLSREPATSEAAALASELAGRIEALEQDEGRQRARGAGRRAALVDAAGRFIGALAQRVDDGSLPEIPASRDKSRFSQGPLGWKTYDSVYQAMLGLGLIEVARRGSFHRNPAGGGPGYGKAGRICATAAFVSWLRTGGVAQGKASQHFPDRSHPEPLRLNAAKTWAGKTKRPGRSMPVPDNETTQRLAGEIEELNTFIRGVKIEGAEATGWTRVFNDGDRPDFAWDRGGRLYARPADRSYQNIGKAKRLGIRLDGEPVAEVDLRASHLSLALALNGQSVWEAAGNPPGIGPSWADDLYRVDGVDDREVVKAWVTVALGNGNLPRRWPADLLSGMAERGVDLGRYPVADVGKAVLSRYPVLANLEGLGWAKLQWVESNIVLRSMQRLNRELGVAVLPVHDSLILSRDAAWIAARVLAEEFRAEAGQPMLTPKFTPPVEELPAPHRTRFAHLLGEPAPRGVPRTKGAWISDGASF